MIYIKIKNYLIIIITQKNSKFFFDENKKVIRKIKDEAAGMPIKEFTGDRSKMYSYRFDPISFSKIKELTEDTIEDIKKCERLKEYTINKITTSKFGSFLDDSILKEIDRCKKKLKETTKDQVKNYFIYESKKCKGISKHTVKKDITIDNYRDTLFNSLEKKTHTMKAIRSHNHILTNCEITKCSLYCFDNKRYILEDRITTLAYGHYESKNIKATWQEI